MSLRHIAPLDVSAGSTALPFTLRKLDFDNGTEFLNAHFVSRFKAHEPRVELSLWNVSTRPVHDAGVFLQSTLLFVRQAHAVHVFKRSTQGVEQHAVRLHHLPHHQFPVGGGCADAPQIILIMDADLRQPRCAAWPCSTSCSTSSWTSWNTR